LKEKDTNYADIFAQLHGFNLFGLCKNDSFSGLYSNQNKRHILLYLNLKKIKQSKHSTLENIVKIKKGHSQLLAQNIIFRHSSKRQSHSGRQAFRITWEQRTQTDISKAQKEHGDAFQTFMGKNIFNRENIAG
jgi:hypothetical protein